MRCMRSLLFGVIAAVVVLAAGPAWAQGHAGVFGGIYEPEDADSTEIFGLRGGYRFHPNFGFEASLGRVDLADAIPDDDGGFPLFVSADLQIDLDVLDLSFQWFPTGGGLVVFGGPGWSRIDFDLEVDVFDTVFRFSDSEDMLTAHAGVGYEWDLGERFYVRPEGRVRHFFGDDLDESEDSSISYQSTDWEATVTFGFRFGAR